ncbi:MAG: tripartite tricarboxylate transporter TctB family protein [Geminicoccaceae bacterium]
MATAGSGGSQEVAGNGANDSGTGDVVLGIFVMLLCVAFLLGTIGLPDSPYEPLGPASFPRGIAVILAILAALVLLRGARRRGTRAGGARPTWSKGATLAVATYGLTILFGLALSSGWIGYRIGSIVFLLAATMLLAGARRGMLPIALALAVVLGLGTHFVFTSIFVVDLP